MAELSAERAEVNARIVYWGCEGAGKSANLDHVHRKLRADHRGDLRSAPTALDPSVSYEMLPITLGEIAGMQVRLHVVAVPGAPEHGPTRKQLLDRVDGVVLVLDCRPDRIDENLAAFDELRRCLGAYGRSLDEVALVVQYNKRDEAADDTLEELHRKLELDGAAFFEAVATQGKGVLQTLTTISKQVIRRLREEGIEGLRPEPASAPPPPEPEPLSEPASPVESGLLREHEDPDGAARDAAPAAQAEAFLDTSWRDVADEIAEPEAPVEDLVPDAEPAARSDDALRIDTLGAPRKTGERSLVVPVTLRDDTGRRVSLAVSIDIGELIDESGDP